MLENSMSNFKPDGVTPLLTDEEMRELGFTDRREGYWYWSRNVDKYTSLNFTIQKDTGYYEELVMDENFGQPDYYGRAKPEFRDKIVSNVNAHIAELNSHGLSLAIDHRAYGCKHA